MFAEFRHRVVKVAHVDAGLPAHVAKFLERLCSDADGLGHVDKVSRFSDDATNPSRYLFDAKADASETAKAKEPNSYGVSLAPLSPEARQQLGLKEDVKGALIAGVDTGSPAEDQGLRAGDVLQQVGREQVTTPAEAVAVELAFIRSEPPPSVSVIVVKVHFH